MEHNLSSSHPHFPIETETQVYEATNNKLYSVPSHFLYSNFHNKAGCSIYVQSDTDYPRDYHLNLRIFLPSAYMTELSFITKVASAVYLFLNFTM